MTSHRKRSYDPAGLRARILDVAADAFQANGYHSTSTHAIMREAGTTGGAFHHHFPTKKSLGLAVIKERVDPAVEQTWIRPIRQAGAVLEGVLQAFDDIANSLDKRGKILGCPLNNLAVELSLADAEFQLAVGQVFESWKHAIADKARSETAETAISADPEEFATLVVASYSGAIAMAKATQNSEPLRTCARQLGLLLGQSGREHARKHVGPAASRNKAPERNRTAMEPKR